MGNIGKDFNTGNQEASRALDPIPAGWVAMRIVQDEVRQTKDQSGGYLWLDLEVDENYHPHLKGRHVFARLNLWNNNAQAVDIARRDLTAICLAVGVSGAVEDTSVLWGKTLAVKLSIRKSDEYSDQNEVRGFDAVAKRVGPGAAGAAPAAAPQAPRPPAAPAPQGAAPPPQQQPAPHAPPPQGAAVAPWKR